MSARFASVMARLGAQENPPPWGLASALYGVVVALIAMFVGTFVGVASMGDSILTIFVSWIIGCALTVGFVVMIYRRHAHALRLESAPIILVLLISLGLAMLLDLIGLRLTGEFLPVPELLSLYGQHVDIVTWVASVALMVFAQPIAEELIFRGIALPSFRARFGPWPGLLLCAIAYGLFHQFAYASPSDSAAMTWYSLVLPLLVGLFASSVRAYTGSTRAAIVAHMAFGVFAVLKAFTLAA